jgi:hypothetical protein
VIAWLEANPVGKVLAGVLALLLATLVLLMLAWSMPPHASNGDSGEDERALSVQVPGLAPTAPIEEFAVITDRPVFIESRQPELFEGTDGEELAEGEAGAEEADVEPPEVALSGVVITPTQRIVTLRPKDAAESLIALEGNPLEGDFGSWQVRSIEPRSVVLSSGSGEEVRIDLQIHDAMIKEPPKPPPSEGQSQPSDDDEPDRPLSRAEEIRQRIAERREELRREAEENAEARSEQSSQPNYQDAIKQMIQGKRTRTEDENE